MKFGVKKNRAVNETFFAPRGTPPTYLSSLSTNTIALVARLDRLSSSLVNLSMARCSTHLRRGSLTVKRL